MGGKIIESLQKLGKALMGAVAVMPVAAILMGIGYWIDPDGWGANNWVAAVLITLAQLFWITSAGSLLLRLHSDLHATTTRVRRCPVSWDSHSSSLLLAPEKVAGFKGIDLENLTDEQALAWASQVGRLSTVRTCCSVFWLAC